MTFVPAIDRFRVEDREAVETLYRRVFGDAAADAFVARWEWLYGRNPNLPKGTPLIWLARDGETIIGQYATMPVRLSVNGAEIDAAWGMDVMIAPERQRFGLGRTLFDTWDRNVGAALGLSLTDGSHSLFEKMKWPYIGRVPRLAKALTRAVLENWGGPRQRVEIALLPLRRIVARVPRPGVKALPIDRFDESFTRLWDRVASKFALVVRRDAAYLNWKFLQAPHLKYSVAAVTRDGEAAGYVVIRHVHEPRWKVTLIVDFLADPADPRVLRALLRWVDAEAIKAGSDVVRVLTTHSDFARVLRESGYRVGQATMRFVAKVNAIDVPPTFYDSVDRWHVTLGDSDADR
jgi:hypothetical protein